MIWVLRQYNKHLAFMEIIKVQNGNQTNQEILNRSRDGIRIDSMKILDVVSITLELWSPPLWKSLPNTKFRVLCALMMNECDLGLKRSTYRHLGAWKSRNICSGVKIESAPGRFGLNTTCWLDYGDRIWALQGNCCSSVSSLARSRPGSLVNFLHSNFQLRFDSFRLPLCSLLDHASFSTSLIVRLVVFTIISKLSNIANQSRINTNTYTKMSKQCINTR